MHLQLWSAQMLFLQIRWGSILVQILRHLLQRRYVLVQQFSGTDQWGVFEFPAFASGTKVVAQALTEVSGISVVGGGDSAAAVRALGFADSAFGYISTGGGEIGRASCRVG